uniref:DEAF1 transcription factor n=1 Tax=Oryzias latipes TaxID=8090 RepID=A0A3P9IN70_ORYLA
MFVLRLRWSSCFSGIFRSIFSAGFLLTNNSRPRSRWPKSLYAFSKSGLVFGEPVQAPCPWLFSGSSRGKLGLLRASCFRSVILGYCRFGGDMEEADSATKAFGLVEPPIIGPPVEGVGSETESEAEVATMAVMPEPGNIDIGAESMPNSDEASYSEVTADHADVQTTEDSVFTTTVAASAALSEHMLNNRTTLQLGEGLSAQKATLIVVHTDGSIVEAAGLKSAASITAGPQTPTTPLTPPQDKDSCSKYNWDPSVYNNELPVRCRNTSGVLHKLRLGSGGKGRCIKHNQQWFTPTEFEALSGRASSKDWKRSIRYAGRPLLCLIQERILNPHAASCTCLACCDDLTPSLKEENPLAGENISMTGPVRLFVPYKRRKKDSDLPVIPTKKELPSLKNITLSPAATFTVSPSGQFTASETLTFDRAPTGDATAAAIISDGSAQGEVYGGTAVLTALPALSMTPQPIQAKVAVSTAAASPSETLVTGLDVAPAGASEAAGGDGQKHTWLYLEELANTLLANVQQLKALIEQAKSASGEAADVKGQEVRKEQPHQNQISFQQPDDSEAKRNSDITEIIINDWKDHQHSCCQPAGGLAGQEEEPGSAMEMDKVK